jgi:hypothetical protein
MGISNGIKKQAMAISQRALERIMADERRAARVAQAIGALQRGKRAFDRGQDEMLRVFSFAAKGDYRSIGKQLSALKRRLRDLDEKLDQLAR